MIRRIKKSSRFSSTLIWFLFVGNICAPKALMAQDVMVRGGFIADSILIGDQTRFYLSASYPKNLNILFPDSTFGFTPFEYERKSYFPTVTKEDKSYDSVVYYLSTFEVDRIQTLRLPVLQLNERDCTVYESNVDTVLITQLVPPILDTIQADKLPLKINTAYHQVPYVINYPLIIISVAALILIATIVWFAFGKKIRKHFRIKRMLKSHKKFLDHYNQHIKALQESFTATSAEVAIANWKYYMEQLEQKPYTKLTTREISRTSKDQNLTSNLQAIDKAIYGHNKVITQPLENLKAIADERFNIKLQEVKRG